MSAITTVLLTILVLCVLILIHELGHFLAARAFKITVNEFCLGMGPLIWSRKKNGTLYGLRALPIGGFVSMEGEDEASEDPRAFCNQKVYKKIIVTVAGAVMNLILGLAIVSIIVSQQKTLATTIVAETNEGLAASQTIQVDDRITKINGQAVHVSWDILGAFNRYENTLVTIDVLRNGEKVHLEDVEFVRGSFSVYSKELSPAVWVHESFFWALSTANQIRLDIASLFMGKVPISQLSGPVGIGRTIGEAASMGFLSLLYLVSIITINLGLVNLLPLPALDGGRLLFMVVELVRGKPIPSKYEGVVHAVGFVALMLLIAVITLNDVFHIFG